MFHTAGVTKEQKNGASKLLEMPEKELSQYWIKNIAVDYLNGKYLKTATLRSKKMLFARWKHELEDISKAEAIN